jgi:hypothetical protein
MFGVREGVVVVTHRGLVVAIVIAVDVVINDC